ncbi:MAG: iron ABC transporter permease [Bacteroidales bacterium]|nr:iron ABC transporter permease [Bacteroidales bacterium]HOY40093.1 iron ABC transporter permease [Bacteroidales bacterium]HQP05039.1 iron ABC transporter permease [Bacteroidales bacterium]
MQKNQGNTVRFGILLVVTLVLLILDFQIGTTHISLSDLISFLFNQRELDIQKISLIKEFRLTRVITAVLAGGGLSLAGLLMQSIFRNPLAGPYVLGVSSGAGLGVAILVMGASIAGVNVFFLNSGIFAVFAAMAGAALVMLIVISASLRMRDNVTVLIIGILLGAVITALISVLQFFADSLSVKSFVIWGMGSLSALSFNNMVLLAVIILLSFIATFSICKPLNLFLLGEENASVSGVNTRKLRVVVFAITCVLAGTITAFCGPIGFIGIAVPHMSRWMFKTASHFVLVPAVFLTGATVMLLSDMLSYSFGNAGVLPINAVTAVTGVPVIIYVVIRNQKSYF